MTEPPTRTVKSVQTMEKHEIVEHILRTEKNYYTLFQLPRTCTAKEVEVVYKKMALKCHPDKNEHPKAQEAFKVLVCARDVLTNPDIRKNYGRPQAQAQAHDSFMRARRGGARANAGSFNGMDSFEQLFSQLFSGGTFFGEDNRRGTQEGGNATHFYYTTGPGAGIRRQHGNTRQTGTEQPAEPNSFQKHCSGLLMFLPLFLFVLMALVMQSNWDVVNPASYGQQKQASFGRRGERLFSLTPSAEQGFTVRRFTSLFNTQVEYFVAPRHAAMLKKREMLVRVERDVLKEKKSSLERRCAADRHNNRAKGSVEVPVSCEQFRRLAQALG